jgi:hypothetical protein
VRLARFGAEALVAAKFGRLAIRWLNSDVMQFVVGALIVLALGATAMLLYGLARRRGLAAS